MIKNNDILNFIGLYHYYEKKDKGLGINSLLYAINIGCIESIYHLGLIYYNDNKLKDAEKYFLMSSKKHDFSLFYLYEIYKHSNEKEAKKIIEKAYKKIIELKNKNKNDERINKQYNKIVYAMAEIHSILKEYNKSIKYYTELFDNGNNYALKNIASEYLKLNDYDMAIETLLKSGELGSNNSYFEIGNIYKLTDDFDMAEYYYILECEVSENPECYYELFKIYSMRDKKDEQEKYILMAFAKDKTYAFNVSEYYKSIDNIKMELEYLLIDVGYTASDRGILRLNEIYKDDRLKLYKIYKSIIDNKNDKYIYYTKIMKIINDLEKEKIVYFYSNKSKFMSKIDSCPICYENKLCIARECTHHYCLDCFVEINKQDCPICRY